MLELSPLDRAFEQVPRDEFMDLAISFHDLLEDAVVTGLEASERVYRELGLVICHAVIRRQRRDLSDDDITFWKIVGGYER